MTINPDNEMPCDCCNAETGETVWRGDQDDIGDRGMFLCPICIKLSWHSIWTFMMLDAEIEKAE